MRTENAASTIVRVGRPSWLVEPRIGSGAYVAHAATASQLNGELVNTRIVSNRPFPILKMRWLAQRHPSTCKPISDPPHHLLDANPRIAEEVMPELGVAQQGIRRFVAPERYIL